MMWMPKMKHFIDFSFTFERQGVGGLSPASPLIQAAPASTSAVLSILESVHLSKAAPSFTHFISFGISAHLWQQIVLFAHNNSICQWGLFNTEFCNICIS